jgi:4-amino-4-deoxy-L-arabinose transferase-like glycosyltransferase
MNNFESQNIRFQEAQKQHHTYMPHIDSTNPRSKYGMGQYMDLIIPRWISTYAIGFYIAALLVVSMMYSTYSMPWFYMLSGVVSVLLMFFIGQTQSQKLRLSHIHKERLFEKKIFLLAFVPRLLWVLLIYTINMQYYNDIFGFENADALFYDELANEFSEALSKNTVFAFWSGNSAVIDVSDMGYASYMGFIYWLTGNSVIVVRLLKCIISAFTVILLYRLTKRNFGGQVARVAAILCAMWPNFWYYCGTHLKETEMVFLGVLFVEQADQMLKSRQFTAWKVVPILLIAAAIFTFRTPLGLIALLALGFSVIMSSTKVVSWGKRIIVGGLAIALIGIVAGNRIQEQSRGLIEQVQSGQQEKNMEWRSIRDDGGNSFAKYAGAAVFAPMIFTLPFPTMVQPYQGQDVQQLLNGGNFCKNILSCFTIFALIMLLMSGRWREHLLPLSFMLGYLVVLSFSTFAQSERFHQPVMPLEFMSAAYGLSIAVTKKKYKRWFTYWCVLMFVGAIAWNWFKLAGRGLT